MAAEINMMPKVDEIMATDLPDIEKLAQAFGYLMEQYIAIAGREQDLQKALGDKEAVLKMQIQKNTLEYALSMFEDCYRRATGRRVTYG